MSVCLFSVLIQSLASQVSQFITNLPELSGFEDLERDTSSKNIYSFESISHWGFQHLFLEEFLSSNCSMVIYVQQHEQLEQLEQFPESFCLTTLRFNHCLRKEAVIC
jgi:hypothetical protein